ncbi:pyridine nucleotide-disulfide oxidoreductase [Desulfonema ishimotonii]|uniref:Pyridine nucleotide-disulfide oxidoreductase n=2 Tax=Desulfonema ishimotonii TaxID=45657 RepID=A0A401G374_9BACT|nr:pyridine nucleotide-disulfide oxidoreductase [Desulfonema ishimotonii]
MGKHLVLVGGGHAHLTVLRQLDRFTQAGHEVTVISTNAFHYYSGMGPGMLAGTYTPGAIRFHVRKMVEDRGCRFIENNVIRVDPGARRLFLESGGDIPYDIASFNVGSRIAFASPSEADSQTVFPVKPIENLMAARAQVIERLGNGPLKICVAGGGAAGVEIAASLSRLVRDTGGQADVTLIAGSRLLHRMAEKARQVALNALSAFGITVREGVRLSRIRRQQIELTGGEVMDSDLTFLAVGTAPPPLFLESGIPTGPGGGMRVSRHLQSVSHPEIFGGGDCIDFAPSPLARVGVYAVRENPILCHNLMAALDGGRPFRAFSPQKYFMLILNLGDGTGLFIRKSRVWRSRAAFMLKHFIDTRFMRQFQVSGESE